MHEEFMLQNRGVPPACKSALMRYNVVCLFSLQSYVFCPLMILSPLNMVFLFLHLKSTSQSPER